MTTNSVSNISREKGGIIGTVFALLFFGLFFIAGVFFAYSILKEAYNRAHDKVTWVETDCRILHAGIDERLKDGSMEFSAAVTFAYTYDGKEYRGTEMWNHGVYWYDSYEAPRDEIEGFPVGESARCFVNPNDPNEAALRMGSVSAVFFIFIPLISCAIGALGIYFSLKRFGKKKGENATEMEVSEWEKKRLKSENEYVEEDDEEEDDESSSLSQKARIGFGIVCAALFIGGIALMSYLCGQTFQMFQAQWWEETPCNIEFATLITHEASDSDSSDTYNPQVLYSYFYKGKQYKATRYAFLQASTSNYAGEKKIVDDLKSAKNPVCYVNPDKPEDAVLNNRFSWVVMFLLLPVAMILIGIFGGKAMLFPKTKAELLQEQMESERLLKSWGVSSTAFTFSESGKKGKSTERELSKAEERDSNLFHEIEPMVGRKVKFIGVIVMAVFWNAIVSIFVINDFSLFIMPFVLVGLFFIGFSFYFGLAARNPKIVARIAPKRATLGGQLHVQWEFHERAYQVRRLDISLISRRLEITTTREKGETKTHRKWVEIFKKSVFDTVSASDIQYGHTTILIPERDSSKNILPSGSNIRWEIKIHGEIAFYPDINDVFEITIDGKG